MERRFRMMLQQTLVSEGENWWTMVTEWTDWGPFVAIGDCGWRWSLELCLVGGDGSRTTNDGGRRRGEVESARGWEKEIDNDGVRCEKHRLIYGTSRLSPSELNCSCGVCGEALQVALLVTSGSDYKEQCADGRTGPPADMSSNQCRHRQDRFSNSIFCARTFSRASLTSNSSSTAPNLGNVLLVTQGAWQCRQCQASPVASDLGQQVCVDPCNVVLVQLAEAGIPEDVSPCHDGCDLASQWQACGEIEKLQQVAPGNLGRDLMWILDFWVVYDMFNRRTGGHESMTRDFFFHALGLDTEHLHVVHAGTFKAGREKELAGVLLRGSVRGLVAVRGASEEAGMGGRCM